MCVELTDSYNAYKTARILVGSGYTKDGGDKR